MAAWLAVLGKEWSRFGAALAFQDLKAKQGVHLAQRASMLSFGLSALCKKKHIMHNVMRNLRLRLCEAFRLKMC